MSQETFNPLTANRFGFEKKSGPWIGASTHTQHWYYQCLRKVRKKTMGSTSLHDCTYTHRQTQRRTHTYTQTETHRRHTHTQTTHTHTHYQIHTQRHTHTHTWGRHLILTVPHSGQLRNENTHDLSVEVPKYCL